MANEDILVPENLDALNKSGTSGTRSQTSLLLGLLRFETPSLAAAYKKLAHKSNIADSNNQDITLLVALLEGDVETASFGLELIRESLNSLSFQVSGAGRTKLLGYWKDKKSHRFVLSMCREGGVVALMSLFVRIANNSLMLSDDNWLNLLFILNVITNVVNPIKTAFQDACSALCELPNFDMATFLVAASRLFANKGSISWHGTSLASAVKVSIFVPARFVMAALRKCPGGDPNDFGVYMSCIKAFMESEGLHDALVFLLRHNYEDVLSTAILSVLIGADLPGFFQSSKSPATVYSIMAFLECSLIWHQGFPHLRDPAVRKDADLLKSREDDWASDNFSTCVAAFLITVIRMPLHELRPILLDDSGRFFHIVLALLRSPCDIDMKSYGILLVLFSAQDPDIYTRLVICGALEEASVMVHRGLTCGQPFTMPSLRIIFPRMLQWLNEHVTSNSSQIDNFSDPTGFGHLIALDTFVGITKDPPTLIQLRAVPSIYKPLEGALFTAAALTHDIVIYQKACGALAYLDIAAPIFKHGAGGLNGTSVPRARSHAIDAWSVDEVVAWAEQTPFRAIAPSLRTGHVDGPTLLELGSAELVDLGLSTAVQCKVVLDAIAELRGDFCPVVPTSLLHSPPRGFGGGCDSGASALVKRDMLTARDLRPEVFVSYRRSTGSHLARLLGVHLSQAGFQPFIDVEGLGDGFFDVAREAKLRAVQHVVVVLSEGALDRCMTDTSGTDFVKEIALALALGKTVVPVWSNFSFPTADMLPVDIRGLLRCNAVEWSHSYVEASIKKLLGFLRGGEDIRAPSLFISYAWGDVNVDGSRPLQDRAHIVATALKSAGHSVWLDTERMPRSAQGGEGVGLADAMVDAIDGSSAVVACISRDYAHRINCKAEFQYALSRKKTIFYVNVGDEDWKPLDEGGWLAFRMGEALWSDARSAASMASVNGLSVLMAGLDAVPAVVARKTFIVNDGGV
jgi:hypothetical protein